MIKIVFSLATLITSFYLATFLCGSLVNVLINLGINKFLEFFEKAKKSGFLGIYGEFIGLILLGSGPLFNNFYISLEDQPSPFAFGQCLGAELLPKK